MSGLIGAIFGAIIGGLGAYYGSVKLENKKNNEISQKLHCVLILEITGHQAKLAKFIDYVLPWWLLRGRNNAEGKQDAHFKSLNVSYPLFKDFYFKTFLKTLSHSKSLASLCSYYNMVELQNFYSKSSEEHKEDHFIYKYIRHSHDLLEASIMLLEEMLSDKSVNNYFKEAHHNAIDGFNEHKDWYKYLIALSQIKYHQLYYTYRFQDRIPDIIKKSERWQNYVEKAKEIALKHGISLV